MNLPLQQGLGDLRGDHKQYHNPTVVKNCNQKELGT